MKSTFYAAVRSVKQQASAEFYSADILARSYHSGAEGPPLAASPAAHTVQDGDAGAQVPN